MPVLVWARINLFVVATDQGGIVEQLRCLESRREQEHTGVFEERPGL